MCVKVLNNIIPTTINIIKKGLDISLLCNLCKKRESTTHLIWKYKFSRKIWEEFLPISSNLLFIVQGKLGPFGLLLVVHGEFKGEGDRDSSVYHMEFMECKEHNNHKPSQSRFIPD